jgi:hypothetical protein
MNGERGLARVLVLHNRYRSPGGEERAAEEQAELLRSMVAAGHIVSGFHQATSDLEEIFLKVTGQTDEHQEHAA